LIFPIDNFYFPKHNLKIAKSQTQKKDMNIMNSQEGTHVAICRAMSKKGEEWVPYF